MIDRQLEAPLNAMKSRIHAGLFDDSASDPA
jgi:hypothetical protein